MKKSVFIIALASITLGATSGLSIAKNTTAELLLENIEILTSGESGGANCVMTGSVVCPTTGTKVKAVW